MPSKEFMKRFGSTMRDAEKLKKVMQKKNLKLAKAECPECGDWLMGRIVGPRQHLHMRCDGTCKRIFME